MSRTPSTLKNYEQYRPQMKTGDLIAFSGNAGFSHVIKWATRSHYSHVGIVLKAEMGSGFGDSILVIESTLQTTVLDASKQAIKGIQMHWLSKRIDLYDGSVYWLQLKAPMAPEKQAEMEAWLRETHNQKVSYDYLQIYGAAIDWFDELGLTNQPDFSTIFCSELVAKALQIGGAIDPNINPSEKTPDDVVKFICYDEPILLESTDLVKKQEPSGLWGYIQKFFSVLLASLDPEPQSSPTENSLPSSEGSSPSSESESSPNSAQSEQYIIPRNPSNLEIYEQYRSQMQTGDLIAFSGNGGFSNVIKWATKSDYSHVGIVVKSDLGNGFGDDSILIIESTLETTVLDANNKQVIKGVQMHWLSKRIDMYNGSVSWLGLKNPLNPHKKAEMEAWLRETHNQKVRYDYLQIYNAAIDWFDELGLSNQPEFSTLFCSELVAKALKIAGAIDPSINPSEQTPDDAIEYPCFKDAVVLKA